MSFIVSKPNLSINVRFDSEIRNDDINGGPPLATSSSITDIIQVYKGYPT